MTRRRQAAGMVVSGMLAVAVMVWGPSFIAGNGSPMAIGAEREEAETLNPSDYVGITKCAACHYAQYKDWQASPHGKAFDILPTKYKNDASCLECHSTGAKQTGGTTAGGGQNLLNAADATMHTHGVSCESCHGAGGKHSRYALSFVGGERQLSEESLKVLRTQIVRTSMEQCIQCHTSMAHKPHPKYDPEPTPRTSQVDEDQPTRRTGSFFQVHGRGAKNI